MAQNSKKKVIWCFVKAKKEAKKKEEKKENGAHKHRSYCKFQSAQNIHVMLSSAIITIQIQNTQQKEVWQTNFLNKVVCRV